MKNLRKKILRGKADTQVLLDKQDQNIQNKMKQYTSEVEDLAANI